MNFTVGCKSNNSMTENDVESRNERNTKSGFPEMQRRWMWMHLIVCVVCIVCSTILMFVIITWIFSIYFPHDCNKSPAGNFSKTQYDVSSFQASVLTKEKQMLADTINTSASFFVEKNEWSGVPSAESLNKLQLPVPYVIISHTITDFCVTKSECSFSVRDIQKFHMESRHWLDIAYNFMAGGDGLIYIGRDWDYVGAHSFNYNNKSIGISFIGTFNTVVPSKMQLDAVQKLIRLGVQIGKISLDYKLLGQRQISKTLSPGDALYDIIRKWPHWSLNP